VDPREREVREEGLFYLDERARELESQGFKPDEARRRALEAFGNPDEVVARVMERRRPGRRRGRAAACSSGSDRRCIASLATWDLRFARSAGAIR
jgi:hypothetical protein